MDVLAATPFAARCIVWQNLPGHWTVTVVCKATYVLGPGISPIANEREALLERDNHWDDDPERSVYAPGNLSPLKPRPEVTLVGSAYAPRGEPTQSLVARLRIGTIDKAIEVFAPRTIMGDGATRDGAAWKQMPLLYERASGGPHTWNPLGVGAHTVDRHGRRTLPNLQPPNAGTGESAEPIGFGPIPSSWSIRRERLGIRETSWSDEAWAENPLGAGFDATYFQTAPADQWLDALHADELLTLENLHPDHSLLTTRLAGVRPVGRVEIAGKPARDLELVADTLWIDTNRGLSTLAWRAQLRIDGKDQPGLVSIGSEEKGQSVRWPASVPSVRQDATIDADLIQNTADDEDARAALARRGDRGEALPFRAPPADRSAAPRSVRGPAEPRSPWSDHGTELPRDAASGAMPAWLASHVEAPPASQVPPPPVSTLLGARSRDGVEPPARLVAMSDGSPPSSVFAASGHATPDEVRLGGVDERALGRAAYGGVLQASNAAAGGAPSRANGSREAAPRSTDGARTLHEIIWFDPACVAEIRAKEEWSKLVVEAPPGAADDPSAEEARAKADRATISSVITRGVPVHDVEVAVQNAVDGDGLFAPPLAIVAGELETPFDDVETLKILSGAAGPLAPGDKRLKDVLDLAAEVMKTPLGAASEVAASFVARIREAWSKANRMLPADYLDHHAKRLLLEQRLYQKRQLADAEWIRALLLPPGASAPIPAYLPVSMGRSLPLYFRFPARVVATLLPQQDQSEAAPVALRVSAIARVIPRSRVR